MNAQKPRPSDLHTNQGWLCALWLLASLFADPFTSYAYYVRVISIKQVFLPRRHWSFCTCEATDRGIVPIDVILHDTLQAPDSSYTHEDAY